MFICTVLLSLTNPVHAAEGPYFSGNLGFAMLRDAGISDPDLDDMGLSSKLESKSGAALAAAMGYDFGNSIRLEGEISYQKNDMDKFTVSSGGMSASIDLKGDTTSTALLVNAYYDFSNTSILTPFVTAGCGFAKVKSEITGSDAAAEEGIELQGSSDDTVFAYQIGAGIAYAVSETFGIDAKYRYFATSDLDFEGSTVEFSSHNFYFGVRLSF